MTGSPMNDAASGAPDPASPEAQTSGSDVSPSGERPRLVRCPAHGLLYDAASSSGCSRCLGGAGPALGLTVRLRARPRLWLGAGLALALALGAVPAVLYAQSVKNGPLMERRIEAEAIRRGRVDDPQSRRSYAEAAERVDRTRARGIAFSALLWIGTSALLLLGWRRFV